MARPSPRVWRAIALIALAVTATMVASVAYLRPSPPGTPNTGTAATKPVFVTEQEFSYDFVNPSVGWAVEARAGLFRVYGTTDGAKHWHQQLELRSSFAGRFPISVQVVDTHHAFLAVGDPFEQLNRTADGGTTWNSLPLPRVSASVLGAPFINSNFGWLLLAGRVPILYATRDSGFSGQPSPDPPADADSVKFRSPNEGWMGSGDIKLPHVYSSNDGGLSWHRHDLPPPPGQSWNDGIYFPAEIGLLPGGGVVAYTSLQFQPGSVPGFSFTSMDEGMTWRYVPPPPGAVDYEDTMHWWAMKGTSLFKSSDAGQTWTVVTDKLPDWQYVPHVLDSKHAWALLYLVGGFGLALTTDGGLHWTRAAVPSST